MNRVRARLKVLARREACIDFSNFTGAQRVALVGASVTGGSPQVGIELGSAEEFRESMRCIKFVKFKVNIIIHFLLH